MPSKNRLTVNLAPDEFAALDALAGQNKVSRAWLARRAICDLLDRAKREELEPPLPFAAAQSKGGA
jgi:Ribbon-helix-helix protein, copG family.